MKKEVVFGRWLRADTNEGIIVVPEDVSNLFLDDFTGKIFEQEIVEGWGARMSLSGYMDCTEWTLHETEEEAYKYLEEQE